MQANVYNEFLLDPGTRSGTDWVVTMPTKRYCYSGNQVQSLFQRNFTTNGACDDILFDTWDREETRPPINLLPRPGTYPVTLCWDANVVSFNATSALGSRNNRNVATTFQNGAADLQFPPKISEIGQPAHVLFSLATVETSLAGDTSAGTGTYLGLPVIGFAVQSFTNGTVIDTTGQFVRSSYGGNFAHRGRRTIDFTPSAVGTP